MWMADSQPVGLVWGLAALNLHSSNELLQWLWAMMTTPLVRRIAYSFNCHHSEHRMTSRPWPWFVPHPWRTAARASRAVCSQWMHRERKCADTIGTVPVPWAGHFQCQISIYFSNKIHGSIFIKQHSETVMVWNYQNADCSLRKKFYCVIYYNFGQSACRAVALASLAPADDRQHHSNCTHRVMWRHRVYSHDTIAILWV